MADISIEVNGIKFSNPFVIGSGPPSPNSKTIIKAFDIGWSGVSAKTVSLTETPVINVAPRYGKLKTPNGDIIGFENIELISDRTLEVWLDEFKEIKDVHPDKVLIASIMEKYTKNSWQELVGRIAETGVDIFELNFSCLGICNHLCSIFGTCCDEQSFPINLHTRREVSLLIKQTQGCREPVCSQVGVSSCLLYCWT